MTNSAKRKIVRMETYAMFPYLIKITYDNGNGQMITERYVNSDEDKVYLGETYTASYFSIKPPSRDGSSISDGQLTLSTADQEWIVKVRKAQKRMKCTFVACIDYEENGSETIEEIETMTFTLIRASWSENTMTFTMMFDDRMNLLFPLDVANELKIPALV